MNSETVFLDSKKYFDHVFEAIRRARHQVDINVYILSPDAVGNDLIEEIQNAARRGVQCRLLVDGFGAKRWIHSVDPQVSTPNFKVRVFNPIPQYWFLNPRNWSRYGLKLMSKINRRDHKKLVVIDQERAFLGSINFTETSLTQTELGLETAYATRELQWYFDYTWSRSRDLGSQSLVPFRKKKPQDMPHTEILRWNFNFNVRRRNINKLYRAIKGAQKRLWFVSPYFLPSLFLIKHLLTAANRDVDVRLLLPEKVDIPFMKWVARYYYPIFLKRGVKIYEYRKNFLHMKVSVMDDDVIVGSSNLDHRSLFTNLEVDYHIQDKISKDLIIEKVEAEMNNSKTVDIGEIKVSFWQRIISSLVVNLEKRL